ncbi:NinB protein [Paraburkholderia silvatlantica]|uniref:NinB protein n=1 Tax=Paraburkholderia silvatlantica TaxID=321895 RepID=A0A2V4TA93_9BURK|nr:recombination protein NinB [Paraburkholderia silvatlantica]PYE13391.1 NinB protein [Paraburkholderia silvatlantica]
MSATFVLRAPEHAKSMVAYVKAHAGAQAAAGRPLVVSIDEFKARRSSEQNRLYWHVLTEIAEQVELQSKRFPKEAWHEHYKDMFAPKQEGPAGLVAMSTSQMTKPQFQDYVTQIQVHAAQTLGVEFAAA